MTASPRSRPDRASGGAGRRRRVSALAAAAAAALVLLDIAMTALIWRAGETGAAAPAGPADAAVVYFTDDDAARARRLATAIALYETGRAERLALVGGFRREGVATGAEEMARAAIASGVSAADVAFDSRSFDTGSNLAAALAIAREKGWTRLVHVSDAMHLVRIRTALRRRAGDDATTHAFAAAPYGGAAEIWTRAHYEAATAALGALLGEGGLRRLARGLRVRESGAG